MAVCLGLPQTAVRVLLALALACASCQSCDSDKASDADPVLSLLPPQTQTVAAFDLGQIRQSPLWQFLSGARPLRDQQLLADVEARTGFDPLRDIHRLVLAFPADAHATGRFAVFIYAAHLDEKRLVAYARDRGKLEGLELRQEEHAGQRLWVQRGKGVERTGLFLAPDTFILAGADWGHRLAELGAASGKSSAARSPELSNLCRRIGMGHAAWLASVVPSATRTQLAADPRFQAAASVARVAVTLDMKEGLSLVGRGELSTTESATSLATQLQRYFLEARQSPQMLLLGLGPWLQGVHVTAQGPQVEARVELPADQTQALAERLASLLSSRP